MKECVSEHIQMLCMEDTAFARLTMHPKKNMIRCFQYINRKAWDYVQDELKATVIGMSIITATLPVCQMRSMTDSLTS